MKRIIAFSFVIFFLFQLTAQESTYAYEANSEHPYGLPNPDAPTELLDFAGLIGTCHCKSVARNPDQSWGDTTDMIWSFKYIMNGLGVQDETLKTDGKHSGSIRQFNTDSSLWYVHFYSSANPTSTLSTWEGNKNPAGDIILYQAQKAPNGMEGFYKIKFSEITNEGFNWLGEWVNPTETIQFPTWKIYCKKADQENRKTSENIIRKNSADFSQAYMRGDYQAIANYYTADGKIFPNNRGILSGTAALEDYWKPKNGGSAVYHKVTPIEINVIGDYAYDYGYYEGKYQNAKKQVNDFKGKYLIVWKKVEEDWKIYLDIWNSVKD